MNWRLSLQDVSILCHFLGAPSPLQHINVLLELGMPELEFLFHKQVQKCQVQDNSSFPNYIVVYAPKNPTNPFGHKVSIEVSIVTVELIIDHANVFLKVIAF